MLYGAQKRKTLCFECGLSMPVCQIACRPPTKCCGFRVLGIDRAHGSLRGLLAAAGPIGPDGKVHVAGGVVQSGPSLRDDVQCLRLAEHLPHLDAVVQAGNAGLQHLHEGLDALGLGLARNGRLAQRVLLLDLSRSLLSFSCSIWPCMRKIFTSFSLSACDRRFRRLVVSSMMCCKISAVRFSVHE